KGQLAEATTYFNKALKQVFTDSSLQLLNGLNYHLRALSGDSGLFKLAEQGYMAAIRMDPSNWVTRYYLGLLYLDTERFQEAKYQLGSYVLQDDSDPEALYYLAVAAYYAGDAETSHAAALQLWQVCDGQATPTISPDALLRLMSVTTAAVNDTESSSEFMDRYLAETGDVNRAARLKRRIEDWHHLYTRKDHQEETISYSSNEDSYDSDLEFVDNKMVSVDVVIIRTEEDRSTRRGINLLDGLTLQFGDADNLLPAFSRTRTRITDFNDSTFNESTRSIVSTITIPAVSYTLNILNDQDQQNEIIAQPTLVARSGQTSEFFSGVEVLGAAVSGGAGDSISIEKEIGVKLAVTPEFGPDGLIILNVVAERTFLTQPSRSVEFEFRLDTTKTTVNANVAMKYGQTLILSGLNERDVEMNADGVPGLKEVPGVNLLFSRTTRRNYSKSVVILLTPHPTPYLYDKEQASGRKSPFANQDSDIASNLSDRYEYWYQPTSSIRRVLRNLSGSELYRYFQTGDLDMDAWYKSDSHQKRLEPIL
ncbi:MAG: type II and III secretion system protein, partial [Oceanospirillales bacterium]|nr:type II and III secretion system protein [Oceanospirillales bacterium]